MVDKKKIELLANEYLLNKEIFLVNVKVSKNNVIVVTIDGDIGVKVDDCIELSRFIESKMNRDIEDYELTVTSFGLEQYFTMKRQYKKNIGENIEVIDTDKQKIYGVLKSVDERGITLENKNKNKKEDIVIDFDDIDKSRVVINI